MIRNWVTILVAAIATNLPPQLLSETHFQGPVKVFILAGQSNMEGYGGLGTLDTLNADPTQVSLRKKIKNEDGSFISRDDVFIYYQRGDELIKTSLTAGQGAGSDRIGPELAFGITMGDFYKEPVLLIKTAWGGKDLYCDFRPPSAGRPSYEIPGEPRDAGVYYRKMVEEVHRCLDHLEQDFPQFKGLGYEISGFVWFQGWNDMCADEKIRQKVFDEYAHSFAMLVKDLRAEFKVPKLPVVVGEVGVDGEQHVGREMRGLRAAQAKIPSQPELEGSIQYVRTAPYWYSELDTLPRKLEAEERRVKKKVTDQVKETLRNKGEALDKQKLEERVAQALEVALTADESYQKVKAEHDRHISHWECHYWGSARVYALVGQALAEAMERQLKPN